MVEYREAASIVDLFCLWTQECGWYSNHQPCCHNVQYHFHHCQYQNLPCPMKILIRLKTNRFLFIFCTSTCWWHHYKLIHFSLNIKKVSLFFIWIKVRKAFSHYLKAIRIQFSPPSNVVDESDTARFGQFKQIKGDNFRMFWAGLVWIIRGSILLISRKSAFYLYV